MPFCPYQVSFFGIMDVLPVSFTLLVISVSVMVQVLFFVTLASYGDFGPYRKIILMQAAFVGAILCMCTYFADTPDKYLLAGAMSIGGNACFGLTLVMYNAYLPYITKSHPTFMAKMR